MLTLNVISYTYIIKRIGVLLFFPEHVFQTRNKNRVKEHFLLELISLFLKVQLI